ncbi:TetR/AcrR family transcriptional regulator [Paraburkholderia sp. J12]|uniref:TetR/AcrR family transcriptional regulator n=1 Tax=Paraburkholderia sp. J12 TaxID=2805432 RepID=UPI002ABE0FED|nr:TetR/AcrR family transcriptional regulator [Paraburkholderia sp. J12]
MKVQDANVRNAELVAERRAAIVKAAVRVFSERGFQAARTRDVGIAANLTQGTLYNYVRSKEDLLYLICDELVCARMAGLEAALREVDDPKERLVRAVRANIQTSIDYPEHTLLVFRENHGLPPEARDAIRHRIGEHIEQTKQLLLDATEAGYCRFENAHIAANICTFLPSMIPLRQWSLDGAVGQDELVEGVLKATLRSVGCDPDDEGRPARTSRSRTKPHRLEGR